MSSIGISLTRDLFVKLDDFDWTNRKQIGKGAFGECFIVRSYSQRKDYCAKVCLNIPRELSEQKLLLREVLALHSLKHEAILDFYGFNFYDFQRKPFPVVFTEYLPNGALDTMLKKEKLGRAPPEWNNTKKQIIIIGVAAAMRYVHRMKVIHRDLKPPNVLLDSNFYPKLCDFGLSRTIDSSDLNNQTQQTGSPIYMSPEMLDLQPYDLKTDVYSFAIMVYEIITNRLPFQEFFSKVRNPSVFQFGAYLTKKNGKPSFKGTNVNQDFQDFLNHCWDHNPSNRPSFDTIYNAFIDNDNFIFADDIDLAEVRTYINYLQEKEIEIQNGRPKLRIVKSISVNIGGETHTKSSSQTPEEMYQNIMTNGFQVYSASEEIKLFNAILSDIQHDDSIEGIRNFIKVVIFVNSVARNKAGKELQKRIFNTLHFRTSSRLTNETIKPELKERQTLNISPTVTEIAANTFEGNKNLYLVNLQNTMTLIEKEAFKDCTSLRWVNLNNNMTTIHPGTFQGCRSLLYVEFPPQLKTIGKLAFAECTHLTELTIPASVQNIEEKAFYGCRRLHTVHISRNTNIGKKAFSMRTNIEYY